MNVEGNNVDFRRMEYSSEDFNLLYKWLNDESVQEYYEGKGIRYTLEQIIHKFGPRTLGNDRVIPCIIEYNKKTIGYIQFYKLSEKEIQEYDSSNDQDVYGVDLFIGEPDYWNKGLGTRVLKLLLNHLFTELKSTSCKR